MLFTIGIDPNASVPLQDQLIREITRLIVAGRLAAGDRLPGTRTLSEELGISRNTVVIAYQRLIAEGYVESHEGGGTFVAKSVPDEAIFQAGAAISSGAPVAIQRPPTFEPAHSPLRNGDGGEACDFQLEALEMSAFPQGTWKRLVTRRMQSSKFNLTRLGKPGGYPPLKESLSIFLDASRGIEAGDERILIVTGIQQALNVTAQLFVRSGTKVVMEAPCCGIARHLFQNYGADVLSLPVDRDGMALEGLPESQGCLAFVTPTRQYPMGMMLSRERQEGLIAWAERTNSQIVEVDFDGDFRYEGRPTPAMQTLDRHDSVIYVASFAGTLGSGLRIGYMVLPPALIKAATDAAIFLEYGFPCSGFPWLEQAVLNDFIVSGGYEKHLKRLRRLYKARRDALIESIGEHFGPQELRGQSCGTHLIWSLPRNLPDASELASVGQRVGVTVHTLRDPSIGNAESIADWNRILLLGFAATPEAKISSGIARLANTLDIVKAHRPTSDAIGLRLHKAQNDA